VHGQCAGRACPMKMTVTLLDGLRRARRWRGGGGGKGAGRKSVYGREEKTHETRVALLAEVTDGGGRFSAGLEEVE
jgi:hypothetical protein